MRATISCSCGKATQDLEAETLEALAAAVGAALLAIHVTSPHEVHGCSVEFDHVPAEGSELVIECLRKGCERERAMRTSVPYALVGAMALLFHTAHEGHRLRMSYDGRTWESPAEPG